MGRWFRSNRPKRNQSLDALLQRSSAQDPIHDRILWLIDLFKWTRHKSEGNTKLDFETGSGQFARLRYLLQVLDRNTEIKANISATLRSIICEMDAIDLFSSVGIPHSEGFTSELIERLSTKLLPQPPKDRDLGEIFYLIFPTAEDVLWVDKIDEAIVKQLAELVNFQHKDSEDIWSKFVADIREAMVCLAVQAQAQILNPRIRDRLPDPRPRNSSFFVLEMVIKEYLRACDLNDSQELLRCFRNLIRTIQRAHSEIAHVHQKSEDLGVSINLVYLMDRVEMQLARIQNLAELLFSPSLKKNRQIDFFTQLIHESNDRHSLRTLFRDSTIALSKRITERNAETGEMYIARSYKEYLKLTKKALGGGIVISFTSTIKVTIESMVHSHFLSGIINTINYATSFTLIQLGGFTLATKQPAMTATSLSAKMEGMRSMRKQSAVINEIVHLFRSQFISTIGNILSIVPLVFFYSWLYLYLSEGTLLSNEKARYIIDSHNLLGPTPIFAAYTGVLLWLSAVGAGWIDNWATYRRVFDGIAYQGFFVRVFGSKGSVRIAQFWRKNLAGIGGNIILGFLLGMSPKILAFLEIPCDVRHVTISSGKVALAIYQMGMDVLSDINVLWALLGLLSAGIMNIGVSFGIALAVAIRARGLRAHLRNRIYRALMWRLISRPWHFLVPPNSSEAKLL